MKRSLLLSAMPLLIFFVIGCTDSPKNNPPAEAVIPTLQTGDTVEFTILQTTDLHDHASGAGPSAEYSPADGIDNSGGTGSAGSSDSTEGGYARLAAKIASLRLQKAALGVPVMLVDSGDFLMGTVYDMTIENPAAFQFFEFMGYDAITLGNHEFDWTPAALALMINNAMGTAGTDFTVPIVATNMVTDNTSGTDDDGIEAMKAAGVITSTRLITLANGLQVGIIGLMGPTADFYAPGAAPITFDHTAAFIQSQVDDLKNNQGAHIVVALSHSGVVDPNGTPSGDDITLANAVTGIDIIASGHEHVKTNDYIKVGDTYIFCAGHYGRNLARLDVSFTVGTGIQTVSLNNNAIDDGIPGDPSMNYIVGVYDAELNAALGTLMPGITLNGVIAGTDSDNLAIPTAAQESGMANLIADSLRNTLLPYVAAGAMTTPTVGIIANGNIRSGFSLGQNISFADIYGVLPLGMTMDATQQDIPGYPLLQVYLTGAELQNLCRFDAYVIASQDAAFMAAIASGSAAEQALYAALSQLGPDYFLGLSGIQFTHGGIAGGYQVTSVNLYGNTDFQCQGTATTVDASTQYPCVLDLYIVLLLQSADMQQLLQGLAIPIVPTNADGSVEVSAANLLDFRLDADPVTDGIQEVKEWQAFLSYILAAESDGGLASMIPDAYYGASSITSGNASRINP
ncbi:MAG: bifunctional metallophosphatase/5'-nucleotidase [Desulfobacteraceae bacterium]|nr:MAG: bifunctional metallophosphatase/5'-nucleotidase [Desulfobacteraceae bacterium]